VVPERRGGRACSAQVKEEPAQPAGDTEQSTPARPGAIAKHVERRLPSQQTNDRNAPKPAVQDHPHQELAAAPIPGDMAPATRNAVLTNQATATTLRWGSVLIRAQKG